MFTVRKQITIMSVKLKSNYVNNTANDTLLYELKKKKEKYISGS